MGITSVWQSNMSLYQGSALFCRELSPFFHVEIYMYIQEMYFYLQDNTVSNFMKRVNFLGILLFKCGFETLIVFFKTRCIQWLLFS